MDESQEFQDYPKRMYVVKTGDDDEHPYGAAPSQRLVMHPLTVEGTHFVGIYELREVVELRNVEEVRKVRTVWPPRNKRETR